MFNLPTIPPALKTVTPYLQRADELKGKEPIMSYWCAYYAAQVGIALNVKESASREFLFDLLGLLESMKQTIGRNDAIDMEAASAAYVENFAVKVFTMADNEDRNGAATKGTAKKFLAAAHFLEVLSTFPKSEVSEPPEDKIKYAKWKAVDIGKALREGRTPTPGPANAEPAPFEAAELGPTPNILPPPPSPPRTEQTPPPPDLLSQEWQSAPAPSSPSWSTLATPGLHTAGEANPLGNMTPTNYPSAPNPDPLQSGGSLDSTQSIIDGDLGDEKPHAPPPAIPGTPTGVAYAPHPVPSAPPLVHAAPVLPETELTPALIKLVQKHCRYAISALDYEDREQARKELRTALKALE